ncbi:MAG: 16S rRNA (cytosine(967)-C(5))-methyltransferase RsmB [bacterium]
MPGWYRQVMEVDYPRVNMADKETISVNSRNTAAEILANWLRTKDFPDRLMDTVAADRAFVMEVVYGSVKRWRTLTWIMKKCVTGKTEPVAVPYLLVGLYQIIFMTDVADYAAVSETVEASKRRLSAGGSGFVNAVLRRALREKQAIIRALKAQPLAVRESHPDLLVDRWKTQFTAGRTVRLCKWNNGSPDVVICLNLARTTIADYSELLKAMGQDATPHPFESRNCIIVPRGISVRELPGYADGLFSVQDASMLTPVKLLDPKPGDCVLDACAAPGGKTMLIAERIGPSGSLTAMDLRDDRLVELRENLARMRFDSVKIVTGDAAAAGKVLGGDKFDRILADVPCSNTGVLRRRADARWRFSTERFETLRKTQRLILKGLAPLLKPGGTLVYSTCSIEGEEGAVQIRGWLQAHPEFVLEREITLFPIDSGTDGLYAAALRKDGGK